MGDTQPDEPSPAPAALPSTQCDDDGLDGGTEDDEVSPDSHAPKPAWGQLRAASGDALVLEMDGGPYTLGRAESCTLRLTDNKVSGVHARLSHDGANAILEDLSSNGTFVNGTKVGKGRLRVRATWASISRSARSFHVHPAPRIKNAPKPQDTINQISHSFGPSTIIASEMPQRQGANKSHVPIGRSARDRRR
jgi:hypothetical protein